MTETLVDEDPNTPQIDPDKDYLKELVGEGKKFRSPEDLAKGKFESDSYIKILERRLDEYRDDILELRKDSTSRQQLENLVNQLSNKSPNSDTPQRTEERTPAIDLKQIESLVSSKIQEHDVTRQQLSNFNTVKGRLRERFGDNYATHVKQKIGELDISEDELNNMAKRSPQLALNLLGATEAQRKREDFQSPPTSSQRSDSFSPSGGSQKRTWSYYKKLKSENPSAWLDRKTAVQMDKDAIALGEAFYDGDFYKQGLHER